MLETKKISAASKRWLVAICVIAFLFRVVGLRFGFPLVSNFYIRPDETLVIVRAVQFWESFGRADFLLYPAVMPMLLSLLFQCYYALSSLFGFTSASSLTADFVANSNDYFLISRIVSVLAGTATVIWCHRIALELVSSRGALLVAALYAVAPLPVRDAHFAVTDTLMAFFVAWTILQSLRYSDASASSRSSVMIKGAILFGLAIATKYTAVFLVFPLFAAIALRHRGEPRAAIACARDMVLGIIVAFATFLLFNLDLIVAHRAFAEEFRGLLDVLYCSPKQDSWNPLKSLVGIFEPMVVGPGGIFGLLIIATALAKNLKRRKWPADKPFVLLVAFAGFCLPLLPFPNGIPYRYLLPVLPVMATTIVLALESLQWNWLSLRRRYLVVLALLFLPGLWASIQIDRLLCKSDTRTLCGQWIENHVDNERPVLVFGGVECEPQIQESAQSIQRRIKYVHELYGDDAGKLISIHYHWLLEHQIRAPTGFELYRQPQSFPLATEELVAIVPTHPLRMAGFAPEFFRQVYDQSEVVEKVTFTGFRGNSNWTLVDEIDAFFLPMSNWNEVERPGPRLEVFVMRLLE